MPTSSAAPGFTLATVSTRSWFGSLLNPVPLRNISSKLRRVAPLPATCQLQNAILYAPQA
ncbi:MAG TPA: hypothetical protein VIJ22_03765 [Polyangiaceae bacterium]